MFDIYAMAIQGRRPSMEDTFCLIKKFGGEPDWIFAGVYDGHGGEEVAKLAVKEIPRLFLQYLRQGKSIAKAFSLAYQEVSDADDFEHVGTTALSLFIKGKRMYIANAGDSRMILVNQRGVFQITKDHGVDNSLERIRIKSCGGIINEPYVDKGIYGLMPTRSLGDHYFKDAGIIDEPEIFIRNILDRKDIIYVMATDGLWNEFTNKQVAQIARETISAKRIAKRLLAKPKGFSDNVSIVVIKI